MKYKAHQTFAIRKGWLSKGMRALKGDENREGNPYIFMPSSSKQAMDELGLGSNQVVALRYWLIAMGLMTKSSNGKEHEPTPLMDLIFEKDRYVEEFGTLWALHYELACNKDEATSWYWLFNESKAKSFTKEDLSTGIKKYDEMYNVENAANGKSTALSSIEADVDCILRTYIPSGHLQGKEFSPENVIDSPLGDLGILNVNNIAESGIKDKDRQYRKKPAGESTLPTIMVLYAILGQIEHSKDSSMPLGKELLIEELLSGRFSPGRLFNLDSASLLDRLYQLENDGYLRLNRTAGSDVVRIEDPDMPRFACLENYYELIG